MLAIVAGVEVAAGPAAGSAAGPSSCSRVAAVRRFQS